MANAIKFEVIKRNASREFCERAGTAWRSDASSAGFLALVAQCESGNAGPTRPATKILDEWIEYGIGLIDQWDVRMVGKLIECFPSCVPAYWKGRKLMAEYNERGDWVVFPAEISRSGQESYA